ncbi:signal peptidase I [Brachybacterium sacelli]|uniref:Signal peptidase I n=1 Tax=Brachybacterium sacelli TaxID=173364 RepID=A0ABS4X5W7_9MICO|nr:signal peptidase I [Brachybacterium sacelli]MBP2383109.1 signal peptidase [Brachybacterium sacelli]
MSAAAGTGTAQRGKRSLGDRVMNAVLNLAAVGGAICIVLVLLALVFDITLILFRTGSMDPAIPQGSLAVVREVPASQVEVGEVVTVDRDDDLPVTHRVTSIEQLGDGQWQLTMKGDANDSADPAPYTVLTVRTVMFSIPGLAKPVAALNSPWVLGGVTLAVAALVVWALWPRSASAADADADAEGSDEPAGPS